jgi:hypothetical protein
MTDTVLMTALIAGIVLAAAADVVFIILWAWGKLR